VRLGPEAIAQIQNSKLFIFSEILNFELFRSLEYPRLVVALWLSPRYAISALLARSSASAPSSIRHTRMTGATLCYQRLLYKYRQEYI
jgi:hypothetical protein